MKRKSVLYAGAAVLALVVIVLAIGLIVWHQPAFYRQAQLPPGPERKKHSMEFLNATFQLGADSRDKSRWYGQFTTEHLNSYLAENFVTDGTMEKMLPEGMSDPRVGLSDGRVRIAFRYGTPPWSTIVSIDLHVWLVPNEYNVVALEIESIHAGLMPVSVQSMLERVSEAIRQYNRSVEFTWYRYNGHPVALLRFQADRVVPTVRLEQIEVRDGELIVCGCAF